MKINTKSFYLTFLLIAVCTISFSQQQQNISIKGKLFNSTYKTIYIDRVGGETKVLDSNVIAKDGSFKLNLYSKTVDFFNLRVAKDKYQTLILEPGDNVDISIDINSFNIPLAISGSKNTEIAVFIAKKLNRIELSKDSLNQVYEKNKDAPNINELVNTLKTEFEKYTISMKDMVYKFVSNYSTSLVPLLYINILEMKDYVDLYVNYDATLYKTYPDNYFVIEFHKQISKLLKMKEGNVAPDIVEKDTAGVTRKLSSLKGKIVVIDFWASWCGPCRRENPNMVRMYNKYKDKGFEIFGVSLDKDRESWITAIKKDNITWIQVSDLKFWNSEHAKAYDISSIPFTVMLDRSGKIIAKGLRGSEIENKIEEILSKEK